MAHRAALGACGGILAVFVMVGTPTFRHDATPTVSTVAAHPLAAVAPTLGRTESAAGCAIGRQRFRLANIPRHRARIRSASAPNGFWRLHEPRDTVELELEPARSPVIANETETEFVNASVGRAEKGLRTVKRLD
jgi:hypothetical protein